MRFKFSKTEQYKLLPKKFRDILTKKYLLKLKAQNKKKGLK